MRKIYHYAPFLTFLALLFSFSTFAKNLSEKILPEVIGGAASDNWDPVFFNECPIGDPVGCSYGFWELSTNTAAFKNFLDYLQLMGSKGSDSARAALKGLQEIGGLKAAQDVMKNGGKGSPFVKKFEELTRNSQFAWDQFESTRYRYNYLTHEEDALRLAAVARKDRCLDLDCRQKEEAEIERLNRLSIGRDPVLRPLFTKECIERDGKASCEARAEFAIKLANEVREFNMLELGESENFLSRREENQRFKSLQKINECKDKDCRQREEKEIARLSERESYRAKVLRPVLEACLKNDGREFCMDQLHKAIEVNEFSQLTSPFWETCNHKSKNSLCWRILTRFIDLNSINETLGKTPSLMLAMHNEILYPSRRFLPYIDEQPDTELSKKMRELTMKHPDFVLSQYESIISRKNSKDDAIK